MADRTEGRLLFESLYDVLVARHEQSSDWMKDLYAEYLTILGSRENPAIVAGWYRDFVISLSASEEDARLWDEYADNGLGCSLGFRFSTLLDLFNQDWAPQGGILPCAYVTKDKLDEDAGLLIDQYGPPLEEDFTPEYHMHYSPQYFFTIRRNAAGT